MADSSVHTFTEANFQKEVIEADLPVLVDFWAEWCGPCKMIAPVLDEIAREKGAAVKVGKVNVDEAGELAARYQVRAIPTLLLFKSGDVREQIVGMTSKADLVSKIDSVA